MGFVARAWMVASLDCKTPVVTPFVPVVVAAADGTTDADSVSRF